METLTSHTWIVGPHRCDRGTRFDAVGGFQARVDCHRQLRGPYTGLNWVLRTVVPAIHAESADLVDRHLIAVLCAAPELEALLGGAPGTLTSLAPLAERTRWYSRLRTRRIAHGLVELLRDYAMARDGCLTLGFDSVDQADPTDQEFLAIALRRLDPSRVRLVVGTAGDDLPAELTGALRRYAHRVDLPPGPMPAESAPADDLALARLFVDSDGTDDVPEHRTAYHGLDRTVRAGMHDARAAELQDRGEFSLSLGAVPYHRLHGSDPAGAGWAASQELAEYCMGMGFYHAVLENAQRLLRLVDRYPTRLGDRRHGVCTWIAQALAMLDRPEETEPLYYDLLSRTDAPQRHMSIHYALGMLYTRHLPAERKDHERARAHVNTAVAIATVLPDPDDRAFHTVFMRNGLALVEMHRGDLPRSLELVTSGIERLDRELRPDRHRLHRSVLRHNRAQVLAALSRTDEAIAEFDKVIELDPHYSEYHFDRGNTRSRAGDHSGAIADYEQAMRYSPPFPEVYYNRGDARAALGEVDGAMADFRYVVELEPDHIESRICLAALLLETGDAPAALEQAREGLEVEEDNPRLLCLLGQAAAGCGDVEGARDAFDRALRIDDALHEALVNRAALAYDLGDLDAALRDLDQAVELAGDDPDVLFNRGFIRQAAGRYRDAVADYTRALALPGVDVAELLRQRAACHAGLGDEAAAHADLAACAEPEDIGGYGAAEGGDASVNADTGDRIATATMTD